MIRLESVPQFKVHARRQWVVLTIGTDRYLLTPTEALQLADMVVDHAEELHPLDDQEDQA